MISTPFAVITGASRGIGREYARALAEKGYDLLLVARDRNRLELVRKELQEQHRIQVWIEGLDLTHPEAALKLKNKAQTCHPHLSLLILNAGFGLYGPFATLPLSTIQTMLQLHVTHVVESTRLFLPKLQVQQQGAIIIVASVAGFFPIPYMAEYSATKSFLISFGQALAMEVQNDGITIQVCCPGFTQTDFHQTAGHQPKHVLSAQSSQQVVQTSIQALQSQRTLVTVGWQGRLAHWISKILPHKFLMALAGKAVNPPSSKI